VFAKLFFLDFQIGWVSVMTMMILGFGIQLIFMGLIGIYVGKIYKEVKRRPIYSVKNTTNTEEK
jgi:dolichol-phosphate mannosyltransferase